MLKGSTPIKPWNAPMNGSSARTYRAARLATAPIRTSLTSAAL
jgi:hypothetical protein